MVFANAEHEDFVVCRGFIENILRIENIFFLPENGCIVSLALAAHSLRPVDRRSLAYCTFRAFVSGIVIVEGSVAIQRVLCGTLYKHIPYFFPGADKRPKYLSWDMFKVPPLWLPTMKAIILL